MRLIKVEVWPIFALQFVIEYMIIKFAYDPLWQTADFRFFTLLPNN